jgi:hypothetical protein
MTKDEAKAAVMRLMRAECTCGIPGVKEPCFACEMSAGLDVLAQAAANADTLGLLEVLRERYGTPVSIGRRFFMSSTEIIIDGVGYTRDEAQRLLAAVARPQRGSE